MHHLPPLNAIRAFESAARHLSFKQAAEELCVTPGAISRHITNLEQFLGARLFLRLHRQIALTRVGETYLCDIRDGLSRIARATAMLNARWNDKVLRLKLPPTFAIRWLVPRLGSFHARHPEISVQVTTSHDPVDFEVDEVDAAVQYAHELGQDCLGERLFRESLIPVCSAAPESACRAWSLRELSSKVLLHSFRRPDDWPRWFANAGAPGIEIKRSLVLENSTMTYQGAMDGLGVAVAHIAFVADELRSGRLVSPVTIPLHSDVAYFFSYPKQHASSPKLRAFHQWIARQASTTRQELAKANLVGAA
jgi:LysR family glycine cleavage system transcriptional activator